MGETLNIQKNSSTESVGIDLSKIMEQVRLKNEQLDREYASIPLINPDLLKLALQIPEKEQSRTLELISKIVESVTGEKDPGGFTNGQLFDLFVKLPSETMIYHGGDLSYVGSHWTFDIDTALNFVYSGYSGEIRKRPTLRVIKVSDLMTAMIKMAEAEGKNIFRIFIDLIGQGTTWKNQEINIKKLNELINKGYLPSISCYKISQ